MKRTTWCGFLSVAWLVAGGPGLFGAEPPAVSQSESAGETSAVTPTDNPAEAPQAEVSKRAEEFATRGIYKTVAPMLIPGERRPARPAGGDAGAPGLPSSNKTLQMMYEGMDLVLDEEFDEAIPLLEQVLAAEPTLIPVWSTLGWTYWRAGRRDDAVVLWKRFLALDPLHPDANLLMANAYVGTGRLREAEVLLKRSLELNPNQIDPQLILSTVYRWTARYQSSVLLLRELAAQYPDRLDIKNELGISLFENGDYDDALPLLEQGVRALPDNRELARFHALCLLRTGNLGEAQLRARRLLRDDDSDLELLLLLAEAPRYNNDPAAALPYLRKIAETAKDERVLTEAHVKMIEIYSRLWSRDPVKYPLEEPLKSARKLLEIDKDNPYWRQSYGELLLMDQQYAMSVRQFSRLLENSTTNVLAARAGLFEIGQAVSDYRMGREHLAFIEGINPQNPYIHQMRARLELSRGNLPEAYAAIDRLETAGRRGAIAVLQYGTLSDSDWSNAMSIRRFRLHMLTLKQAGYRFLTPSQMAGYFADLPPPPRDVKDYVPPRAVVITFDQVDIKTLRLATSVAEDLDLVFAVHVPVGPVAVGHAGIAGVDTLRQYAQTGRWVFGSMLYDAVTLVPARPDGRLGSALANRIWRADDETYESELAFSKRLRNEYRESRLKLREFLGEGHLVNFMAYPYGEYGQGLLSNVDTAILQNQTEAAINYEIGFTQSVFGHAVNGDNPLMYARYTPQLFDSGEDVLEHLAMHHPVFLARRMRAECAALDGRLYRALDNLETLRRDGYPERAYDQIEKFVYDHLALKFGVARATKKSDKGMFNLEVERPYGGGHFEWFRDSLERRNWRTAWYLGIYLTPVINLEGRAGYGEYQQDFTVNLAKPEDTPVLDPRSLSVTEKFVGVNAGLRYDPRKPQGSPVLLNAGLARHEYRGDADYDDWVYMLESAFRPSIYFDMVLRFDHEAMPSARSLVEGVSYDVFSYGGVLRVRDWWDFWSRANYYSINDGNDRLHFDLSSLWELVEAAGLHAGIEFGYVDAAYDKEDYWTPYKLNQWMLMGKLRDNVNRFYYDITLKFGYAREKIRPEDQAAYDRLVVNARRWSFDPGEGPASEWVPVFSANAALRWSLGRHWHAHWEGLYNESVNYNEFKTITGLSLMF